MSWIVRDAVVRYRHEHGVYRWHQWRVCARDIGLKLAWLPFEDINDGLLLSNTLYLRRGMDRIQTARVAWHEIAHTLLHAGTTHFWFSRPGGIIYVQRLESQADMFAARFPIWDDNAYEVAFGRKRTA